MILTCCMHLSSLSRAWDQLWAVLNATQAELNSCNHTKVHREWHKIINSCTQSHTSAHHKSNDNQTNPVLIKESKDDGKMLLQSCLLGYFHACVSPYDMPNRLLVANTLRIRVCTKNIHIKYQPGSIGNVNVRKEMGNSLQEWRNYQPCSSVTFMVPYNQQFILSMSHWRKPYFSKHLTRWAFIYIK